MVDIVAKLVLLGIAGNLDNLVVGVAYGARRKRIPALANLLIAGCAFLFTIGTTWLGEYVRRYLSATSANVIGAILLIGMGIWTLLPAPGTRKTKPQQTAAEQSGVITWPESIVLGIALSINCLTNGFTAGLWHLGAVPAALSDAFFTYAALWAGSALGMRYAADWLGNKATIAAGCLMILLGVYQLLGG